jgi:hypothetical protein
MKKPNENLAVQDEIEEVLLISDRPMIYTAELRAAMRPTVTKSCFFFSLRLLQESGKIVRIGERGSYMWAHNRRQKTITAGKIVRINAGSNLDTLLKFYALADKKTSSVADAAVAMGISELECLTAVNSAVKRKALKRVGMVGESIYQIPDGVQIVPLSVKRDYKGKNKRVQALPKTEDKRFTIPALKVKQAVKRPDEWKSAPKEWIGIPRSIFEIGSAL